MKFLFYLLLSISLFSCQHSSTKDIQSVYSSRLDVLSIFNQVSVFRTNTGNSIFLNTYQHGEKNDYIFYRYQGGYRLFRDSISFTPDRVLEVNKEVQDSTDYKKTLSDKLDFILTKMDSLQISDVSYEFFKQGIGLKIYMRSKAVMIYVPDKDSVVNPSWRQYVESMTKLDDHWFYAMKDR